MCVHVHICRKRGCICMCSLSCVIMCVYSSNSGSKADSLLCIYTRNLLLCLMCSNAEKHKAGFLMCVHVHTCRKPGWITGRCPCARLHKMPSCGCGALCRGSSGRHSVPRWCASIAVHVYVCVYVRVCVCEYIYIYIYVCVCVCVCVYTYIRTYVCV